MYTMILAIDHDKVVGNSKSKNGLAWHYPEDLAFYKRMTVNKINLMGHTTYRAIGCALPNRTTVVLSRKTDLNLPDAQVVNNIAELSYDEEVMVIGGVEVFRQMFSKVDKVLLTVIDASHEGDIKYEDLDLSEFDLVSETCGENKILRFQEWIRKC